MIDATKISNFQLTEAELQENLLFWIAAAGKNGVVSAKLLENFFWRIKTLLNGLVLTPFEYIRKLPSLESLQDHMKSSGMGCSKMKGTAFWSLAHSTINLQTCTIEDLISFHGIGRKTAAGFLVHTRPNQKYAVLDTHILKFLRDQGIIVPKSTPGKHSKKYKELETKFLDICDKYILDVADLDLAVWNHYRVTPKIPFDIERFSNDIDQSSVCCSIDGRG